MPESAEVVEVTNKSNQIMQKGEKNNLWPQELNDRDKKKIAYISAQYGLDPFFSDLTVLGGNPYVTASGLKRNAHESDDPPTAIQVELNDMNEKKRWWEYKAKLWKESSPDNKPYIEYGEASPKDCNSQISSSNKDLKAMARTRAVNRVIRLAYNISLTSAEELSGYDPESQEIKDVTDEGYDNNTTLNGQKQGKMTFEQAKGVMIPGGDKYEDKPAGEVKDWRLEWVAENWSDEKVKTAAKVVLDNRENDNSKKRELTEREKEMKDLIEGDKELRKEMLSYLNEYDTKKLDDLDDETYGDLKTYISTIKNGPEENSVDDEELAKNIAEELENEEDLDDFDTPF
ncbi:MAG: hypothetical protein ACOCRO_00520 [Halanaerobiales bacterium]